VTTGQIYWGAVPFVVIQCIMVGLVIGFPQMVMHYKGTGPTIDPNKIEIRIPTIGLPPGSPFGGSPPGLSIPPPPSIPGPPPGLSTSPAPATPAPPGGSTSLPPDLIAPAQPSAASAPPPGLSPLPPDLVAPQQPTPAPVPAPKAQLDTAPNSAPSPQSADVPPPASDKMKN
jgi:hypothetical protein